MTQNSQKSGTNKRRAKQSLSQIFAMPLLLFILSLMGLISGLMGDGLPDYLAWGCLALPLILFCWHRARAY